ncbi:MAG: DUF3568 family protein [Planctomycetes bacterium]|nr:DUF3568 family protein [Planctomycetota bacterium]
MGILTDTKRSGDISSLNARLVPIARFIYESMGDVVSGPAKQKGKQMDKGKIFVMVLSLGVVCFIGGCMIAAVGAGAAGTVAYVRGDLEAVEAASLDKVYAATEAAVRKLELTVTKKSKDALSGVVVVRDAEDKKITIKLTSTAEGMTKISIRIGIFGNETKSRLIYEQMKREL